MRGKYLLLLEDLADVGDDVIHSLHSFLEREEEREKEIEREFEDRFLSRLREAAARDLVSGDGEESRSILKESRDYLRSVPAIARVAAPLLLGDDGRVVSAGIEVREQSDVSKDLFRIFREKR